MNTYHPISLGHYFDEIPYLDRVEEENEILKLFISSDTDDYFVLRFENFAAYRRSKESYSFKMIDELAAANCLAEFSSISRILILKTGFPPKQVG